MLAELCSSAFTWLPQERFSLQGGFQLYNYSLISLMILSDTNKEIRYVLDLTQ